MESNKRIAQKNIISGILRVTVSILLPFALRTVMIYSLGEDYVGLNSLFSSILSVLNLAELGFSNAIVYCMYAPIAKGDNEKVSALLNLYKKVYRYIGLIVLTAGIIVCPFVTYLISGTWPSDVNIYVLFCIYLFNTSISYFFFAYKTALLNALKRVDLVNVVQMAVYIFQYLIQIVVLIWIRNYYVYIIFTPICTLALNLAVSRITDKYYPQYECCGDIDREEKKEISKRVRSIVLYRISETTRNSLDSIVLSTYFGLVVVAIYNNYFYIFSAVYSVIIAINQGVQAIIGQNVVIKNKADNLEDMRFYHFCIMWLVTVCSIALICLYQPFMRFWVGESAMFPLINAVLFGVYFYVLNMNDIRNLYYDGNGLWPEGKLTFILEVCGNLLLNIILGKLLGPTGVIIATIITIFVFSFIGRTKVLFQYYFQCSSKLFLTDNIIYAGLFIVFSLMTFFLCEQTGQMPLIPQLLLRAVICLALPNLCMLLFYRRNKYFKKAIGMLIRKQKR